MNLVRRSSPELDAFLFLVEARIYEEIASSAAATPARALVGAGGKRLRASMVWLSAAAVTGAVPTSEALVSAAAALELAHLGSLVHDDVVDGAQTRRGIPSIHVAGGTASAVTCGVALLRLASRSIATFDSHTRRAVAQAVLATCRGQVRELLDAFRVPTVRERIAVVRDKTAAFFELATILGSAAVGAHVRRANVLRRFARRFALAFQIVDDVLDLVGSRERLGRANGCDLRTGVYTLPVVLACRRDQSLDAALSAGDPADDPTMVTRHIAAIVEAAGVEDAIRMADDCQARAMKALRSLPRNDFVDMLTATTRDALALGRATSSGVAAAAATPVQHLVLPRVSIESPSDPPSTTASALLATLNGISPAIADAARPTLTSAETAMAAGLVVGRGPSGSEAAALAFAAAMRTTRMRELGRDCVASITVADCLHAASLAALVTSTSEDHLRAETVYLALIDRVARDRPAVALAGRAAVAEHANASAA
jgi:heptaprenyl diphosphate synthase